MALSRTNYTGAAASSAGTVTSASFTPPNNSLLCVMAHAMQNNLDSPWTPGSYTVTDSAGLIWTKRVSNAIQANNFGTYISVWTAPVTTGTSMTVTLNKASGDANFLRATVFPFAYTGYDTSTPTGVSASGTSGVSDGALSFSLSGTSASSSDVVSMIAGVINGGGDVFVTVGASHTELYHLNDSGFYSVEGQVVSGAVSTDGWADVNAPSSTDSWYYNPPYISIEIKAASSGVTAALTGQSSSYSAGTLSVAVSKALSGQSATYSAGSLTAAVSLGLTGQSSTYAQGSLVPSISVPLTGLSATYSQGTVTAGNDVTVALTGQSGSYSSGSLSPVISVALAGSVATYSAGNVLANLSQALSGQSASYSSGTLSPSASIALSGQQASYVQGTLTATGGNVTVALSGLSSSYLQGTLLPSGGNVLLIDTHDGSKKRDYKKEIRERQKRREALEQAIAQVTGAEISISPAAIEPMLEQSKEPDETLHAYALRVVTEWLELQALDDTEEEDIELLLLYG